MNHAQKTFIMLFGLMSSTLLGGCDQPIPLIPREVFFCNPEKASPQISPDGKRLAYLAPVKGVLNVWVKTVGIDDDQPVSNDTNRGIRSAWWAHNKKHVLYWQDKGGNENWHIFRIDPETKQEMDLTPFDDVRIFVYASSKKFPNELLIGMNKENKLLFDVYRLNIETGKIEFVEKNPGNVEDWVVDHDFKIRAARTMNEDGSVTLLIRNTERDAWKEAITWKLEDGLKVDVWGFTKDAGFSPDDKKLYLHDARKSSTAQFIEYDIATGEEKILEHDPIFDADHLVCDSDNKPLAVCISRERIHWIALDPEFDIHLNNMLAPDDGDLAICNHSDDDRYWVLCFDHDNRSSAYYLYDKETQKSEFIFCPRPTLNEYKLSEMEPVSFTSRDGLKIHGYLSYPAYKQHSDLPLVLLVHGGPWMRNQWGYNPEVQWFTNRGYACLQVNYRGSGGYGKDFLNAGDHESGHKMHNDLVDAVNWAITQGIANPKKVAIYGGSYGGYAALVGATFTPDVFCCAVDVCGPCNWVTVIKSFMPYMVNLRKQFYLRVGDPEKDVDFLKSGSPLFKVDNIKIPVLIGHGANDVRVTQAESEQIVDAMKAKGLPYEYVLFSDEGHGFIKPENRLKFYAIAEKFLAKHLGGRCEG